MEEFPKRKELASLKQLFVLYGDSSIILHALPLHAGWLLANALRCLRLEILFTSF